MMVADYATAVIRSFEANDFSPNEAFGTGVRPDLRFRTPGFRLSARNRRH